MSLSNVIYVLLVVLVAVVVLSLLEVI